jgi:hypothetical protein
MTWLRASLVLPYLVWFVFFHSMLNWFFITKHGLGCFKSFFTCSSLMGILCIVSLLASLVHHHWAWFILFHLMHHWFILTGHCLYLFASLTGSLLLGMVWIVPFPSLIHQY